LELLSTATGQEQEIKGIQIWKEEIKQYYLQIYYLIPKNSTKTLLEIINTFIKVTGYKNNKCTEISRFPIYQQ
jgi:hypothetical protein